MNAKKWLLSLFFFTLGSVSIIELKYQVYPASRHEVDYLINEYIPTLIDKKYDTLMIGDSLAHNAFGRLILKDNILDLTSNQAISMAGNYFLLNRYLNNNRIPKHIYLFCIPGFLHNDLNQKWAYTYFETVFNNETEMEEIKKIKPDLYHDNFDMNRYLERRKASIKLSGYKPGRRLNHTIINEANLKTVPNYMNTKIQNKIIKIQKRNNTIEIIPKVYLNKIIELCKINNINFTLVIEPIPKEYNAIFKTSKWNKYLMHKNINYININDYYEFSTYFFRHDGTHIHDKVNQYYQNLIDNFVVDIY